jgi:hypothetical protein
VKFEDIRVGQKVRDGAMLGQVTEVLKTRIKVLTYDSSACPQTLTYDRAHCQFLEPFGIGKK